MADDAEAPEPPLPEMAPARPPDYNAIRNYSFDDLLMHQTPDKKLTIFNKAGSSVMRSSSKLDVSGESMRKLEFSVRERRRRTRFTVAWPPMCFRSCMTSAHRGRRKTLPGSPCYLCAMVGPLPPATI